MPNARLRKCRLDPLAMLSVNDRSLRTADGKSRRIADVADRGLGRLSWAESTPTGCALGRTGVRAKAAIPLRARMGFAARRRIPWRT